MRVVLSPRQLILLLLLLLTAVASAVGVYEAQIARFARVKSNADRFRQRMHFKDFVRGMRKEEFARYFRLPSVTGGVQ